MIWVCAYRKWAKKVYYETSHKINSRLIESRIQLKQLAPSFKDGDKIIFIGWSWTLPTRLINKFECICMHPSPLPKYRGGSPIQHQIINGETTSAVTYFKMTKDLDAGPIIFQEPFSLAGNLDNVLSQIVDVAMSGLIFIANGKYKYTPQDKAYSTTYKRRKPEQSEIKHIDFKHSTAKDLYNKVRALQDPYPNAFVVCGDGKKLFLKITDYEK